MFVSRSLPCRDAFITCSASARPSVGGMAFPITRKDVATRRERARPASSTLADSSVTSSSESADRGAKCGSLEAAAWCAARELLDAAALVGGRELLDAVVLVGGRELLDAVVLVGG